MSQLRQISTTDRGRAAWSLQRDAMQRAGLRRSPGTGGRRHGPLTERLFALLILCLEILLKLTGLYGRGVRNALDLQVTRRDMVFADLPPELDGLTLLHLSDLHLDALDGTLDAALRRIAGLEVDLCVLTGDYRMDETGPHDHILPAMAELLSSFSARHGVFGVLGNHDSMQMVDDLEALGVTMLVNETVSLDRCGARLQLTGTDDVADYYSPAADRALSATPEGFKVALVHSAELADVAAEAGFDLYLAGHTHGGQVCLPGGRPLVTHMSRHKDYAVGAWRHGRMQGYTSSGIGVSALPVRFNSRGEVAVITLRRG